VRASRTSFLDGELGSSVMGFSQRRDRERSSERRLTAGDCDARHLCVVAGMVCLMSLALSLTTHAWMGWPVD